jgi:predicted porin
MKKLAALYVLAAVGATAHAQSSVTLFGVVDVATRYARNGDAHVYSLASNGLQNSRLGFRGVEDLGDGFKASFWLEAGFNPDSGTSADSNRFFNRRATASLIGGLGELRMGRDFTPTYTGYSDYDAFGTAGEGSGDIFVNKLGTNVDTLTRADNEVSYFTPANLGGIYGQLSVAAGEGVGGKKYFGGRLGYAAGSLDVSISGGQTLVTADANGEDKYNMYNLGASYDFKVIKLTGYASQSTFGDQKFTVFNIGATLPLGAQGTLRASYIYANTSGHNALGVDMSANDAEHFAIGYVYDLSKRTAVYTTAAFINNKGQAAFVVDANPPLPNPNLEGKNSSGFEIGLRHRF